MFFISTFEQSFVFSVRQVNKSHHNFLSWIRIRSEKTAGSVSTLSKTAGPDPSQPTKKMRINSPCWRLPASNNIFFFFFFKPGHNLLYHSYLYSLCAEVWWWTGRGEPVWLPLFAGPGRLLVAGGAAGGHGGQGGHFLQGTACSGLPSLSISRDCDLK